MTITFELPRQIEDELRRGVSNLDHLAKEAVLVELYRQQRLSHHELAEALGLNRFETDGLLKRHRVVEDLPTSAELADDLEDSRIW